MTSQEIGARLAVGYGQARDHEFRRGGVRYVNPGEADMVTVPPGERARLFTDRFSGCVGIGYIALHANGARTAYMRHAYPFQLPGVKIPGPASGEGRPIDAVCVVMAIGPEGFLPTTASDVSYDIFPYGPSFKRIVGEAVVASGDSKNVYVVPYHKGSSLYARTLVLEIMPGDRMGAVIADGVYGFK